MRRFVALLLVLFSTAAAAQTYPTKTVRFVSGVTPGAASDTMARILAEKLSPILGQAVIVENRLGAGGLVGARYVAQQAEPDGHTIMMYASAFTVSTLLNPGLDPKELAPLATVATIPTVLVTPPGKFKSVAEFVGVAKAQAGRLVCADAGVGSATHMAFERFRFAAGFEAVNVHTKGPGEALTEVLSGRADCYFALIFQAQKLRESGKVGALVAAKTPRSIVERLHKEINALVQSPEISEQIRKLGADPLTLSIAEFDAMIKRELEENAQLIKKAGITPN